MERKAFKMKPVFAALFAPGFSGFILVFLSAITISVKSKEVVDTKSYGGESSSSSEDSISQQLQQHRHCPSSFNDEDDSGGVIFSRTATEANSGDRRTTTTTVSFSPEKWAWLEKRRVNNLSGEKGRNTDIIRTIRVALKPDRDSFLTTTRVGVVTPGDDGSGLYYNGGGGGSSSSTSSMPSSLFPFTLTTPSVMTYVS